MNGISVVIPSYNRGKVLLDTLAYLQSQTLPAVEIIVVDQTDYALDDPVAVQLNDLHQANDIVWLRREQPSIPQAMNAGLLKATCEYVLFLDDDIKIAPDFIEHHLNACNDHVAIAHVGQVLQPNEVPCTRPDNYQAGRGLTEDFAFPFRSDSPAMIANCMAGNLCVVREVAIKAGGFDENFTGAAYRFESEFCRRLIRYTRKSFYFTPYPVLHHLQCNSGGTRAAAHHLVSASPHHSMGGYYYALLEGHQLLQNNVPDARRQQWHYIVRRFLLSIKARFYLRKPWYIPVRLLAELRGFALARRCFSYGQRLIDDEVAQ